MVSGEEIVKIRAEFDEKHDEDGLGKILKHIDEMKGYIKQLGGVDRTEELAAEKGASNKLYIDFSDTIDGIKAQEMVKYLRDYWNIPVDEEKYTFTGVWAERWILVLDEADWANLVESEGLVMEEGVELKGLHRGKGFSDQGEKSLRDYERQERRSYCFVNWGDVKKDAQEITISAGTGFYSWLRELKKMKKDIMGEDTGIESDSDEGPVDMNEYEEDSVPTGWGKEWKEWYEKELARHDFLAWEGVMDEIEENKEEMFTDVEGKLGAWYACHELCHSVFWTQQELPKFLFERNLEPLEILLYYTETGRKILYDRSLIKVGDVEKSKAEFFYELLGMSEAEDVWYKKYEKKEK